MRRSWGALSGCVISLSLVLSMTTASIADGGVGTSDPAAGVAPDPAVAEVPQVKDDEEITLRRLPASAQAVASSVDLPRPAHGAAAVRLLGDELDEAAAANDMAPDDLLELLRADSTAWLDTDGRLFYKDLTADAPSDEPVAAAAVPLPQTFTLHSKPGAQKTVFLDFDGATVDATNWHAQYPGLATTHPAWDPSGNGAAFDDAELTSIQVIWESVAEDYAPFDVDVTTADPGPAAINRSSGSDTAYGSHALISPSTAFDTICAASCGGVAYVGVFNGVYGAGGNGYGFVQPAWIFPQGLGNSPKNIAEATTHEVGHNLGFSHDGNATQGYDTGHGAWAPIMGVGYHHPISQWSKGDYAGANNQEDDLASLRGSLGLRTDESGSSVASAAALPTGTAHIASRTDIDTYLLGTCSGAVTVSANPLAAQANLDVKLTLHSATGAVIATADPASAQTSPTVASGLDAQISQTLASGTYYVAVDGVGNGPWSTGYDDYGSIGAYTLSVSGSCNGAAPTGTPSEPLGTTATPHATDPTVTVAWSAPRAIRRWGSTWSDGSRHR